VNPVVSTRSRVRWRAADGALLGDGLHLRVDERDSLGLVATGSYEPYETALLLSLITPESIVLDVGANVGYHTVQFARAVGPLGRVFAFEPDPDNLRLLAHNVRTNGFDNVTIVPKAVTSVTRSLNLFLSPDNHGDHRVYDSGDGRQAVHIDAVAIDEVMREVTGPVSLIKLDIQGAEPAALRGMEWFLSQHPESWIATELWPAGLERSGSSLEAYLHQLRSLGAALLRIDERRQRIAPLDLGWLSNTVTVQRGNHTNLLLPRRDWVRR
jgi:FkbM family methyltransferase